MSLSVDVSCTLIKVFLAYPAEVIESRTLYWLPWRSSASFKPATYFRFSYDSSVNEFRRTYALANACLSILTVKDEFTQWWMGLTKVVEEEAEAAKCLS